MKIKEIITGIDSSAAESWIEEAEVCLRQELEIAWLRGWKAHSLNLGERDIPEQEAADYAERVVGGSTRPERPEVSDEF